MRFLFAALLSFTAALEAQSLAGSNVRVSTHDLITTDAYAAPAGPPDVLQQNEPSVAVHPTNPDLIAVGMNDVRTLAVSDDAWQGLAFSTNGGSSFSFEALVPGYPGDNSAEGLASPVRGNQAGSDPWLGFDKGSRLFFAFIAFQRQPPGRPEFDRRSTNAIAVAKYHVTYNGLGAATGLAYDKAVVIEQGTVGLGRQEDKEALAVDNTGSPFDGNIYVCWARFTGNQDHLKVARSTDHGESYQIADLFADSNMQGCNVTVAPNGNVYVSWRTFDPNPKNNNPQDSAVWVARSTNGGASFGKAVRVATFVDYRQDASRTPPVFRTFSDSFLAADANGVYVAWTDKNSLTGADVKLSRSLDGGATWETPVSPHPLAPANSHQLFPFLAAAAGQLSVAWYDSRSEPAFNPHGPVTGDCPLPLGSTGAGCRGLDLFYTQTDTSNTAAPLSFASELQVTSQSFNPNLFATIKALRPFIGDYISLVANGANAYLVWTDNRDINPSQNALEDFDQTTDPPSLINARSRDANIYFQKIKK